MAVATEPAHEAIAEHLLREFCHALLFETQFNATEAYLKVNPAVTRGTAGDGGYRLLKRAETQSLLVEMTKAAWERNELDQDYIIGMWIAMSQANVMDFFEVVDEKGTLRLRDLSKLDVVKQRNIASIEVTTEQVNEMVTSQRVKLKIVDRKGVLDSMAKAGGMFGDLGKPEDLSDVGRKIEEGFERIRRMQGGKTFDGTTGNEVQEGEVVNG